MTPISTGNGSPGELLLPIDDNRYWLWIPVTS